MRAVPAPFVPASTVGGPAVSPAEGPARRVRARRGRGLKVAVTLVVLLAAVRLVPPFAYVMLPAVVVAGEASPLVAALALGLAVIAATRRPRRRGLTMAALLAAAVAGVPWVQARAAQRAGASAIAALRVPPPAAPAGRLPPGDPPRGAGERIDERALPYAAADGTPLRGRLLRSAGGAARPTFVVVYGGAWRSGDAEQGASFDRQLVADGYTVVALDYRHAPAFHYPAPLDDVRRGLRLVRDSAAAWGVDPARLILWGRSSGAHLALLAAWDDTTTAAPPVRGVIDYYGPVDLVEGYRHPPRPDPIDARDVLRDFLGGTPDQRPSQYRDASPITHVRPGLPPTLLIYGGHDHLVEARFGRALDAALAAAGDAAAYVELPWAEHGFDAAPGGLGERVATALALQFAARVTGRAPGGVTRP